MAACTNRVLGLISSRDRWSEIPSSPALAKIQTAFGTSGFELPGHSQSSEAVGGTLARRIPGFAPFPFGRSRFLVSHCPACIAFRSDPACLPNLPGRAAPQAHERTHCLNEEDGALLKLRRPRRAQVQLPVLLLHPTQTPRYVVRVGRAFVLLGSQRQEQCADQSGPACSSGPEAHCVPIVHCLH